MTQWCNLADGVECRIIRAYHVEVIVSDFDNASDAGVEKLLHERFGGIWEMNGDWTFTSEFSQNELSCHWILVTE